MVTLTNARVFDGTQLLPGTHDVSLRGRRIAAVDAAGAGPQDEVIDLHGMTLLPGLITSHLHPDFYKYELTSGLRPGLERPPGVMMAIGVRTCRVLLESGFTGYSGAACAHDIDAQLKMAISEGIIPGPRIRACGHHIGTTGDVNNQDAWWRRPDFTGVDLAADGPTELRHLVRDEIRRGVETIKIFASAGHGIPGPNRRNLSRDEIAAVVDDRARARRQGPCPRDGPGDDPRVPRPRRRRHRPRRRDRRRVHRADGRSRDVLGPEPRVPVEPARDRLRAPLRRDPRGLRPREGDAPDRAQGRRAHPHR